MEELEVSLRWSFPGAPTGANLARALRVLAAHPTSMNVSGARLELEPQLAGGFLLSLIGLQQQGSDD